MGKYKTVLIVISILVLAAVNVPFAWQRIYPLLEAEYWYEYPISESSEEYTINHHTILEALEQGQSNVFATEITADENTEADDVGWKLKNFSLVASAFHEFITEEAVDSWILHRIRYSAECSHPDRGFYFGGFQYFRITQFQEQEMRLVHEITIAPRYNATNSFRRNLSPVRESWEGISQEKLLVTAEEAIQIAERNGGSAARVAVENECTIDISLAPGSLYDGWQVVYSRGNDELFKIEIDPMAGDYRVIK